MADTNTTPLTEDERSELEALRAEKARREAEEQAARDRAELEALRAEQERVDAEILRQRAAENAAAQAAQRQATPSATPGAVATPEPVSQLKSEKPVVDPDNLTFGQKMVLNPEAKGEDGVPGMAPAQKIIIAIALISVIAFAVYIATQ